MGLSTKEIIAYKSKGAKKGFSGMDGVKAMTMCDEDYMFSSSVIENKCYEALKNAETDREVKLAMKYAEALEKGYTGSFADWKKENITGIIQTGGAILWGLLDSLQQGKGGSNNVPDYSIPEKDEKKNTGVYVVVGLGVVALVGFGLYKLSTKK
jgi:poly(A) polymerase Pap1